MYATIESQEPLEPASMISRRALLPLIVELGKNSKGAFGSWN